MFCNYLCWPDTFDEDSIETAVGETEIGITSMKNDNFNENFAKCSKALVSFEILRVH